MIKKLKTIFVVFITIFSTVFLLELIGQNFIFKGQLYFINNVDHRLMPNEAPDINSDGIRSFSESDRFRQEDLNIIFLGDSFIFGLGLPYNKSIPYQFEEKARKRHPNQQINVANFGWTSSSPLLSYRLLKDIGKKYNPDIVILAIDMTDFHDDIKYLILLEKKGIYQLVDYIPISFLVLKKIMEKVAILDPVYEWAYDLPRKMFFITEKPLSETRPYFSYIQQNIEDINTFSKKELNNAKFILMILPRSYQYSDKESPNNWEKNEYEILGQYSHEPFKYFESIKNEVDYPIHSLLPDFQNTTIFPTCFDHDPHWNEEGARIAAEAIYKYCLEEGCFK
ncbi:hypothetical protein THIOM_000761 [Candidatus Thiomargarita nelsonii]|uniref:AlgX/AlgJ SGNH hydrolase-like domain-containing protein n=1 Tax=Candidatus Thiomargarita nelsonii TaxID=1003181 RepID=A0A176S5X9_9GAMM|nr:hypothetical protein THIOM_000761 [Candidatus Thiomargarita nelsonii]